MQVSGKRRLLILSACAMFVLAIFAVQYPLTVHAAAGDTADNPILIRSEADLSAMNYSDKYFKLAADLTGVSSPIGYFSGSLDGNGHTIDIDITDVGGTFYPNIIGLFQEFRGTVKNLGVLGTVNVTVTDNSYTYAGGLAGFSCGEIINCYSRVDVTLQETGTGRIYAGGLIGQFNGGSVRNSYATGDVSATGGEAYAGLLFGAYDSGNESDLYYNSDADLTLDGESQEAVASGYHLTSTSQMIPSDRASFAETLNDNLSPEDAEILSWAVVSGENDGYPVIQVEDYEEGDGGEDTPYLIYNLADLNRIRDDPAGHYRLMNDISVGNFSPIGEKDTPFTGSFDGDEHTVTIVMVVEDTTGNLATLYAGLFGYIGEGGSVRDLTVAGSVDASNVSPNEFITGYGSVNAGGVAGYNAGSITGCTSSVTVTGSGAGQNGGADFVESAVGGLVGYSIGPITDCSASGEVSGSVKGSHPGYFGGLAGYTEDTISGSFASGDVQGLGESFCTVFTGGLVGRSTSGSLSNSHATGTVNSSHTGNQDSTAGGLAGTCDETGTITNCYATGAVVSTSYSITKAGGLVGDNSVNGYNITASYAAGDVTSTGLGDYPSPYAGGLVCSNSGSLTNCHAEGKVTGAGVLNGSTAGGLVSENWGDITRCFATGDVNNSAGGWQIRTGGLLGSHFDESIIDCYATGTVTAYASDETTTSLVGGLIGYSSRPEKIKTCYSACALLGGPPESVLTYIGGLFGTGYQIDTAALESCYFDGSIATTQTAYYLIEYSEDEEAPPTYTAMNSAAGVTPLTTAQMQGDAAAQNMLGFDFNGVWMTVTGDYPQLVISDNPDNPDNGGGGSTRGGSHSDDGDETISTPTYYSVTNGTGIRVAYSQLTPPEGVTLISPHISGLPKSAPGKTWTLSIKLVGSNGQLGGRNYLKLYNITLIDENGKPVTGYIGRIYVRIPIPEGITDATILNYDDHTGIVNMGAMEQDGYLEYHTTHCGYYLLTSAAGRPAIPETGATEDWHSGIVAMAFIMAVAVAMYLLKKRSPQK